MASTSLQPLYNPTLSLSKPPLLSLSKKQIFTARSLNQYTRRNCSFMARNNERQLPLLPLGRLRLKVSASSGEEAQSNNAESAYLEEFSWSSVILPFLFPALGGLLFGYDIGATSGATISLQSAELSGTTWYNFSAVQLGLVVCFLCCRFHVLLFLLHTKFLNISSSSFPWI